MSPLSVQLSELAATAPYNSSRLILLQQFRGSELLVNCPLTVETTEEGGVNVLTLPISIAIQKEDTDTLNVVRQKRRARASNKRVPLVYSFVTAREGELRSSQTK